jgi:signal transduction histidine kinase
MMMPFPIKFSVKDTGMGIKKQSGENIPFFVQEDLSTTRKFGGTGLGLVFQSVVRVNE